MKIRIFIICVIFLSAFAYKEVPCIHLKHYDFINSRVELKKTSHIFILFGDTLCKTCHAGRLVDKIKKRQDVVFIVPKEYSDNEIDNLKYFFSIYSKILRGDEHTIKYLKLISSCLKEKDWKQDIYISVKAGSITAI